MFGKSKVAFRHNLKLRTAARVASAARKSWRDWFGHKERLILTQLRTLAEDADCDYPQLYFSYLEIRGKLRSGQEVIASYYTGLHEAPTNVIFRIINLANVSVESCPWRVRPKEGQDDASYKPVPSDHGEILHEKETQGAGERIIFHEK